MGNEIDDLHREYEAEPFAKVARAMVDAMPFEHIRSIVLDEFEAGGEHCEYIVLTYLNGAVKARNANMDSLSALIEEAARLIEADGYYEGKEYQMLKEKCIKERQERAQSELRTLIKASLPSPIPKQKKKRKVLPPSSFSKGDTVRYCKTSWTVVGSVRTRSKRLIIIEDDSRRMLAKEESLELIQRKQKEERSYKDEEAWR